MDIVAQFEADHPTCVVVEVPNSFDGGLDTKSHVILVPPLNWEINEEPTHREKAVVVSLVPLIPLDNGWPLVVVDVYVVSSEDIHAQLRHMSLDESPTSEYKEVGPTKCVKLGPATLSTALGDEDTTTRLHCQYRLDLRYNTEKAFNPIDFFVKREKKPTRLSMMQKRKLDLASESTRPVKQERTDVLWDMRSLLHNTI